MFGVDGVALAGEAPVGLAGRSVHLDDLVRVAAQKAGEPGPVGPGSLDTERDHPAVVSGPRQQRGVAPRGGEHEELAETASEPVKGDGDVLVNVATM